MTRPLVYETEQSDVSIVLAHLVQRLVDQVEVKLLLRFTAPDVQQSAQRRGEGSEILQFIM